jgi:hypothetical protein
MCPADLPASVRTPPQYSSGAKSTPGPLSRPSTHQTPLQFPHTRPSAQLAPNQHAAHGQGQFAESLGPRHIDKAADLMINATGERRWQLQQPGWGSEGWEARRMPARADRTRTAAPKRDFSDIEAAASSFEF